MSFLGSITQEVLRKFGYQKQAEVAHVPSFPDIAPFDKTTDYMEAYKGWVYANVKRRAEQMANVQFKLVREGRMGLEEVLDHPAVILLETVNNQMTKRELLELLYSHMDLSGEGFWHVDRGESATLEPQSIIPLMPDRLKIVPGKKRLIDGYIYRVSNRDGTPKDIPLQPEEVVFFKEPNPTNLFRGQSIVRAAAQTIDVDEAGERWNWHSFRHGTSAKPVFDTDQVMDEESLKRQYTMLQENYTGVENANKPMILMGGLKASNVGMSQKDMEFIQGQRWTRDKVMALFGTTKTILGITEDVNRANAETNEFVFAKYMVKPRVEKVIDYLNEFYLPMFKGSENVFFMIDDPVPANVEQETEVFSKALAGGSWMTPNEVRQVKGLETIDNGDSLYIPNNLIAIDGELAPEQEERCVNDAHRRIKRNRLAKKEARERKEKLKGRFDEMAKHLVKMRRLDNSLIDFRKEAEKEGGFHDQMKQFARSMELDFKKAAQDYFAEQLESTLKLIQSRFHLAKTWKKKRPSDNFVFNDGDFKTIGLQIFTPLLSKIMEERGNEALFFIGSNIGFDLDNPRARRFIEQKAGLLIKNIDDTTQQDLRKELSAGLEVGEGIPDLQERVKKIFDKATDSRAERIARTETIKASNAGQRLAWEQSGVVEGKQWLTAADERVCPLCNSMDGKFVALKKSFFREGDTLEVEDAKTQFVENIQEPPLHAQCRCTLIPVLKGTKQIAKVTRKKHKKLAITQKEVDKLNNRLNAIIEKYE